jgi:carbonic anhydrase
VCARGANVQTSGGQPAIQPWSQLFQLSQCRILCDTVQCDSVINEQLSQALLEGKPLPGSIPMIAKAIQPAVADLLKNKKDATVNDLMNAAVEANVRYQMKQVMGSSELLRKAQADGKLTLVMAIYDVDTGAVRFLD